VSPGFTYTFTGNALAIPSRTLSITIVRNGIAMGYTGMVVGSFGFAIEDGLLTFTPTFMGRDEATQTVPTATWLTGTQRAAYGAGKYKIEVKNTTFPVFAQNVEVKTRDEVTLKHRFQ